MVERWADGYSCSVIIFFEYWITFALFRVVGKAPDNKDMLAIMAIGSVNIFLINL